MVDLAVTLGRLQLRNPILVASGTFGYAREMAGVVDFAIDPEVTRRIVARVRDVCPLPLIAKLTPNVTDIVPIARAAAEAGADAVSLVNTFVGMAIDWRRRRPVLGHITGGLSG